MKTQKLYIVGAGPGKPDLITLRGSNILGQAEVIIYDYLVDKRVLEGVKPEAELICCDQLAQKGKYLKRKAISQNKINQLMIKKARQGKRVVRLKSGDPAIFSRLSEELEALTRKGIEFEIVPGVTAASAASAYSGIPITDRRFASSCTFITGHESSKEKSLLNWKALKHSGTLILYMAVNDLKDLVDKLIRAAKDENTPVAVVQNASRLNQKLIVGRLNNIVALAKKNKLKSPAIIIIGEVVKLQEQFNWFKKNKRILFSGLSQERFFLKGNYTHLPLIRIVPMEDYKKFDKHLKSISSFDWIVFTSRYGVKYFFQRLRSLKLDNRSLASVKLAVVGQSTAKGLLAQGLRADLVPSDESAKGLIKAFKKIDLKAKKVFLPRSDLSDKGLEQALKKQGALIVPCFAYRNLMPDDLPQLDLESFDEIMFSSPSTAKNFKQRYQRLPQGIKIKSIGSVTKKAVRKCQLLN